MTLSSTTFVNETVKIIVQKTKYPTFTAITITATDDKGIKTDFTMVGKDGVDLVLKFI